MSVLHVNEELSIQSIRIFNLHLIIPQTVKFKLIYLNIGWLHWCGVVCWALLRSILLGSVAPHKVHRTLAPSVQPIKVFSVYHLHAPPPGRSVPLQWLAPQFGIASLCRFAHSLELFLRHSFLNLIKAVLCWSCWGWERL